MEDNEKSLRTRWHKVEKTEAWTPCFKLKKIIIKAAAFFDLSY